MWGKKLFKNKFNISELELIICKQPRHDKKNKQITTSYSPNPLYIESHEQT